ncbi:sulfotransferase family protein [Nocardioides anomalus]|nr:sulfotransferase [Nocardioides anomalus]
MSETAPSASASKRRVVFVVGSGRSGTSTMAGALQALGMHVPQPEVRADETNPKGFAESKWVVDLHHELLQRENVQVSDARPGAWYATGKASASGITRARVTEWLGPHFAPAVGEEPAVEELVVKDPRLAWFLGLWKSAALRCDAQASYVTMLRHVTEVVGSKQKYYSQATNDFSQVQRTAAWVNMMLHTERATREGRRAFVRYDDLLSDWTVPVFRLGQDLDLEAVKGASANDIRKVHQFIDPGLKRVATTWAEVEVPERLRELAEETWSGLSKLAEPGGDTPDVHATLDEVRAAYVAFYDEAEAVAQSSVVAARREGRQQAREEQPAAPRALATRAKDKLRRTLQR